MKKTPRQKAQGKNFKPVFSGSTEGITAIAKKLQPVVADILKEKGSLTMFALMLPHDSADKWDVVVAGDWMTQDEYGSLQYIGRKVTSVLGLRDVLALGGIATLRRDNPLLSAVLAAFHVEGGLTTILDTSINGVMIKAAVLLYAKQ